MCIHYSQSESEEESELDELDELENPLTLSFGFLCFFLDFSLSGPMSRFSCMCTIMSKEEKSIIIHKRDVGRREGGREGGTGKKAYYRGIGQTPFAFENICAPDPV